MNEQQGLSEIYLFHGLDIQKKYSWLLIQNMQHWMNVFLDQLQKAEHVNLNLSVLRPLAAVVLGHF
jgi:hypothetical protein